MLIEVSSLFVSVASLLSSYWLGKKSVSLSDQAINQARSVADRASADWRQQQWFTLFVEANSTYDLLDRYHSIVRAPGGYATQDVQAALGAVTLQMKKTQGLALVFPQCSEVDALFAATRLSTPADYSDTEKLAALLDASEGLRQRARMSPDVLRT